MRTFISNSFSMNMLDENVESIDIMVDKFIPTPSNRIEDGAIVNVANQQTLDLLNAKWQTTHKAAKESITLQPGDVLYVIQYNGPRINNDGSIPKGAKLRFFTVEVVEPVTE